MSGKIFDEFTRFRVVNVGYVLFEKSLTIFDLGELNIQKIGHVDKLLESFNNNNKNNKTNENTIFF